MAISFSIISINGLECVTNDIVTQVSDLYECPTFLNYYYKFHVKSYHVRYMHCSLYQGEEVPATDEQLQFVADNLVNVLLHATVLSDAEYFLTDDGDCAEMDVNSY